MSTLVSDIITQAFVDIGAIAIGGTITPTEQTDGFLRLNQLIASLSAEGAIVQQQVIGSFTVSAGLTGYSLGSAGTWNAGARAQRITAWKITSGAFTSGGAPLSLADFDAAAQAAYSAYTQAEAQVRAAMAPFYQVPSVALGNAQVPMILGADTAYPLINVRVFPAPAATGVAEIAYWTPISAFATVNDVVSLPPGFELLLHSNLAVQIYPIYGREGGMDPGLAAMAQNSKAVIMQQNAMQAPPPAPPAR